MNDQPNELDEQLQRLADRRAERTPATVASDVIGRPVARGRTPAWWLAAAAMLAVLAGGAAWLVSTSDDEEGSDVAGTTSSTPTSSAAPETTAPPETTSPPETTAPETTVPTQPTVVAPPGGGIHDRVAATSTGIELRRGDDPASIDALDVGPTALAFATGEVVVHQATGPEGWNDGPILVTPIDDASATEVVDLGPLGPPDSGEPFVAYDLVRLLDAGLLDGRPTALVERRTSGATPEATRNVLLHVDIENRGWVEIGEFGGWESGISDARMTDGAIVMLRSAEGFRWIQVIDYDGTELWSTEEVFDGPPGAIAVSLERVWAFDVGWNLEAGFPTLTWQQYELRTGEIVGDGGVGLTLDGVPVDDGYCHRPLVGVGVGGALCSQTTVPAIEVDMAEGFTRQVDGLGPGLVTAPKVVSREWGEYDRCDFAPSYPHDVTRIGSVEVDGRQMEFIAYLEDDRIGIQGWDGEQFTERLLTEFPATVSLFDLEIVSAEPDADLRFTVPGWGALELGVGTCELVVTTQIDF